MTTFTVTNDNTIPAASRPYVDRLRRFLQDQDILNTLDQVQESTNVDLYFALQDALDEINVTSNVTDFTAFSSTVEHIKNRRYVKYPNITRCFICKKSTYI